LKVLFSEKKNEEEENFFDSSVESFSRQNLRKKSSKKNVRQETPSGRSVPSPDRGPSFNKSSTEVLNKSLTKNIDTLVIGIGIAFCKKNINMYIFYKQSFYHVFNENKNIEI
jgi:hypothetical protein